MRLKIIMLSCLTIYLASNNVFADSTALMPQSNQPNQVPQQLHSNVDTTRCTSPIESSAYVIVLGNGGANMNLTCPPDYPVMYSWRQELGFVGLGTVVGGGGRSWVSCCAMKQEWKPAPNQTQ